MARGSVGVGVGENEEDEEDSELCTDSAFDDPDGTLHVDVALDEEMGDEIPFSNVNLDVDTEADALPV